jgi:hypothetical protein
MSVSWDAATESDSIFDSFASNPMASKPARSSAIASGRPT